jgi:hypothetical protein
MKYAYTASPGKTEDDKFDIEKLKKGETELRESNVPNRKAMRVMQGDSLSGFMNPKAGAGRGKQGGPTAKELQNYEDKQNAGVYTIEKGKPPTDPEGMAKGGMTASRRADGIAQRGKTRGTMVMCGGGMARGKK